MLAITPFEPAPQLAPVIERFFYTTGTVPEGQTWEHTALPSIMQSFILSFTGSRPQIISSHGTQDISGDLVLGQHTTRFRSMLTGQLEFLGVHFTPTGLYRVVQRPMTTFANCIHRMADCLSWYGALKQKLQEAAIVQERNLVVETLIIENLLPETTLLMAVATAAEIIRTTNGSKPLPQVAREAGLSERSMQRYFSEYIGISPKAFARIARFNGVTRLMETEPSLNWQHILVEAGYFDAAHFANDFKAIAGQTPSEYYKGKTDYEAFFYGT